MEELITNLRLDFFENEEIIEVVGIIDSFEPPLRHRVLALCLALSNASSTLVPNTLKRIKKAARNLVPGEMEKWIVSAFDLLDSQGIDQFIKFIAKISDDDLNVFRAPERLRFKEVSDTLETYLRGVSGLELVISTDNDPYTDTATVYFPPVLSRFKEPKQNLLIYILMAAHKWAQIACGTLTPDLRGLLPGMPEGKEPGSGQYEVEMLFKQFPEKELAVDLFTLLEAFMLDAFLWNELPGLMRRAEGLKNDIFRERPSLESLPEKTAFVEGIYHYYLSGAPKGAAPEALEKLSPELFELRKADSSAAVIKALFKFYGISEKLKGDYSPVRPVFFLGTIKPERVSQHLRAMREKEMKKAEGIISKLLHMPDHMPEKPPGPEAPSLGRTIRPEQEYLMIKGKVVELDDELKKRIKERGGVPGGVLVKGSDLGSGSTYISLKDLADEEEEKEKERSGGIKYDEWDYKRGDYKKQWCSLYEQDTQPGDEPFVETTLKRYSGYVTVLRKKFEFLKTEPVMLKKQKDGDNVDFDAIVEAFSDVRAGLSPAEDLFMRIDRQRRNIAVLFLVDMSGSTKGWVNKAEKEALVLMCEALEILGDRYAIYGFSGMSRTKCDYYRIKAFDEPYSQMVRKRIAGISPKDYTRMGPAIRHSTALMKAVEARVKLLITLSDGKPEDWGAYKGEYGIEDTRKALIEAKEQGIHPFCITIDQEAGTYLPHMYGETSYIVIDDVRKLPGRITEIYRKLTV